ncbi:pyridoxamine 5'-phosphate oxidase family protein [Ekhidna sp.]|uniref:pyridoxamine 5'-phosphate oxidase family protein n=1 Tax=Ekhidna sp. TaxID=2608089 RepID=UPI00329A6B18
MELKQDWKKIRKCFKRYGASSFHFAMATVKPDGSPWVTPIGSLLLNKDCTATYFEIFTRGMPGNLETNNRIVVMGVNSNFWFWLKSVITGRFSQPPALRMVGTAHEARKATDEEKHRLRKYLAPFRRTSGYKKMWSRLEYVRDITFEEVVEVNLGAMTRQKNGTGAMSNRIKTV